MVEQRYFTEEDRVAARKEYMKKYMRDYRKRVRLSGSRKLSKPSDNPAGRPRIYTEQEKLQLNRERSRLRYWVSKGYTKETIPPPKWSKSYE